VLRIFAAECTMMRQGLSSLFLSWPGGRMGAGTSTNDYESTAECAQRGSVAYRSLGLIQADRDKRLENGKPVLAILVQGFQLDHVVPKAKS